MSPICAFPVKLLLQLLKLHCFYRNSVNIKLNCYQRLCKFIQYYYDIILSMFKVGSVINLIAYINKQILQTTKSIKNTK